MTSHSPVAIALAALMAPDATVHPAPGWGVLFVLLGVIVTAIVVVGGHAFWFWRRRHGPLKSADETVRDLAVQHRDEQDDGRRQPSA